MTITSSNAKPHWLGRFQKMAWKIHCTFTQTAHSKVTHSSSDRTEYYFYKIISLVILMILGFQFIRDERKTLSRAWESSQWLKAIINSKFYSVLPGLQRDLTDKYSIKDSYNDWIWHWFLRYDTKAHVKEKRQVGLTTKLKTLCIKIHYPWAKGNPHQWEKMFVNS